MAIIGIDLGTSNSAAAVLRGGRPVMIPSAEGVSLGGKAFPSYVAIAADGAMLIGEPARRQAGAGRRKREFPRRELSVFLVGKTKRAAEVSLGEPVKDAVVTVPAYFDDN